ncbi:AAA family ATPase [Weissella confusa]|uniref:ParA family protein n=1 Tax=Weissella confusa TaxID=1583 RepID=UPI0018F15D59|nr:AAA family ATPase [Weissella confusa]
MVTIESSIHPPSRISNLHLIPGDLRLTDFEVSRRGAERALRTELQTVLDKYDYILIDTSAPVAQ